MYQFYEHVLYSVFPKKNIMNPFLQQMFSTIKYIFHFFLVKIFFCKTMGLKICDLCNCSFSICPTPLSKAQGLVITDKMFSKLYPKQYQLWS